MRRMGDCSHDYLLGDRTMKKFFKDIYEAIKAVQQARAEAVLKGQHWI